MQKIMFSDKYGLTKAVLSKTKTITRRNLPRKAFRAYGEYLAQGGTLHLEDFLKENIEKFSRCKIGEIVAIAQSYEELYESGSVVPECLDHIRKDSAGYNNKMFTKAELMPHQILITGIRVERLKEISNEDCLKEGIQETILSDGLHTYGFDGCDIAFLDPYTAFRTLFCKLNGYSVWDENPWVVIYEFELVK